METGSVQILNGQSASGEIDVRNVLAGSDGTRHIFLRLSADGWTAARLTLMTAASSGSTFYPIYLGSGIVGVDSPVGGIWYAIEVPSTVQYIKVGSVNSTTGVGVNQGATRTIYWLV